MKDLTNEQVENLNDFIAKKIEESKFKKKEKDKRVILRVGTESIKKLIEIFNLKNN